MKKTMKHITSFLMILVLASSFATSAFADRMLIIPDLPKQPYRYGVGAYEGVVAHSTATPEAPAINIQKYESLEHGEMHLFTMQSIGMKRSKLLIKNTLLMAGVLLLINDLYM